MIDPHGTVEPENENGLAIITYVHRHGTDSWIVRESDVVTSVFQVMLESLGECDGEVQEKILVQMQRELISRANGWGASEEHSEEESAESLYADATGEYFHISNGAVCVASGGDLTAEVAEMLDAVRAERAEDDKTMEDT